MTERRDVVVVGAGPTGLLLAGDLAAAGVSVAVLEQRPAAETNLTRAFAVHARTLEALDARGLADDLLPTGAPVPELRFLGRAAVDLSTLPTRFPFVLVTPQYNAERLLEQRALRHGAEIVRGTSVEGLRQDADGVHVRTATGTWRAGYVVGCDGLRSAVRTAVGLPFPGRTVARSVVLADVRLADPPADVLTVDANGHVFGFVAPFGDGWYRVIAWRRDHQVPDDTPVDVEEVRRTLREALGTDHGLHDARWVSRFHSDERQVPHYRSGRVFLAGDAAHVHSPAGGQGMNTGLQDAANLGWKLAAAVSGRARPGLLDTYESERHPIGRLVLRTSGGMLRVAFAPPAALRVGRAAVGVAVRVPAVARRIAATVSGIGLRYPAPPGSHPLTGTRAPDVALAGGGRLYEALRDGCPVLVGADPAGERTRVRAVRAAHPDGTAVLVRPDGYVGWAAADPTPGEVRAALDDWRL